MDNVTHLHLLFKKISIAPEPQCKRNKRNLAMAMLREVGSQPSVAKVRAQVHVGVAIRDATSLMVTSSS